MELFGEFCSISKPEGYILESTYRDGEKAGAEFEDNFSETLWEIRLKVERTRLPIGRLRVVAFLTTTARVLSACTLVTTPPVSHLQWTDCVRRSYPWLAVSALHNTL